MSTKQVEFEIKIIGDAVERLKQITGQTNNLAQAASNVKSKLINFGQFAVGFNQLLEAASKLTNGVKQCVEANKIQQEAETKLAQVMRNTMGAAGEEIQCIKELASAQQKLGVIGNEVQLAGAQELGIYLTKAESLKKLMPVMNDMLAQQYGLNASQESAVNIASMMGKVMDGQVGDTTGVEVMDHYMRRLTEGKEEVKSFCKIYGLRTEDLDALIFILTGMSGPYFRMAYQLRLADDLLLYTDLPLAEVARRSDLGSHTNFCIVIRRERKQTPTERREALRHKGDAGRYRV